MILPQTAQSYNLIKIGKLQLRIGLHNIIICVLAAEVDREGTKVTNKPSYILN